MDSFRFDTRKMYEDEITKLLRESLADELDELLDEYIAFCDAEERKNCG